MPKGKGMAPLFLAFLLFHVEHFNVFNNREVMRLSLGAALADELVSDLLPVAVTTASFLAFVLLYRWNRFYVREKRGLAISCCLIAMVPVLWAVRDVVDGDSSAMLGCLAMGLFAFGHLCFLPAVVKRLAAIGPAKTVFLYGMVLACGTLLRAVLERLPDEALIAFIVLTPFAMFACFRWIEGHGELRVDLDVEARALIPRTLLATLLAVGLLAGLAAGMGPDARSAAMTLAVSIAVAAIVILVVSSSRMDFNKLIYLISFPLMIYGVSMLFYGGSLPGSFGHALFYFGYDFFYAALWPLYSYLVRYSTFNYYWLPVIGAFGSYLGRALGLVSSHAVEGAFVPGLSEGRWLVISILLFATMLLAIAFYGKNNMKSGWGSITLRANAVSEDEHASSCETLAAMAGMTAREKSVFVLLAKGYTSKLIAEKLNISPGTAKTHIKHIYSKLGLHSQQELIAVVEQNERQSQG